MAESIYKGNIEDFNKKMQFLMIADQMKGIYRQTILMDKSRRETDAEHSWHIALMAMVLSDYAPKGTDINRVIKMVLVHDLVEIYAGDTFCYDYKASQDKEKREMEAANRLFSIIPDGEEYKKLWIEFDEKESPDAIFAAALDCLQPFMNNFITDGHTWRKGGVTLQKVQKRMAVIEKGLPAAWELVQKIIVDSVEKGYIKEGE
ncbi:MAG: HD domain-containing protein [Clostridia bacterium]|nr:HD domain-containing protein [Clostridia bacterium]